MRTRVPANAGERQNKVKISVLSEDCAAYNSVGVLAEHGLSLFVEFSGQKILFDTGQSSVFAKNARRIGVQLAPTTMVVLSHGHYDHTGGLAHLLKTYRGKALLVAHPDAFETKIDKDGKKVGCPASLEDLKGRFELLLTRQTRKLGRDIYFLTGLKRDREDPGTVVFHRVRGRVEPDPVLDDSSLALRAEGGLFIVCGCAHAGMLNILDEARESLCDEIWGLAGGFHLLNAPRRRIRLLIQKLKELKVERIYPCHCTGIPATFMLGASLGARKISCGDVIEI